MPDSSDECPRRRGAPPGNQNALKHGFYARHFPKLVVNDTPDPEARLNFNEEVLLLRLFIQRVLEISQGIATIPEAVGVLRALSVATNSLTRLAYAQDFLNHASNDDFRKEFAEAMDRMVSDLEAEQAEREGRPYIRPEPEFD